MTLSPDLFGFRIIELEETGSTNSYLKQLCISREVEAFTVVTTESQTAGRGQRGNFWESEPGKNLTFSLLIRPGFLPAGKQFLISQIISLSIKEELDCYERGFSIKWPNDIYWNDCKICGILIENNLSGSQISESILGAGINLNQKHFKSSAPNPISLTQITGLEYDRKQFLTNVLRRLKSYYEELRNGHPENITANYHQSLYRKNGFHAYEDQEGKFKAEIIRTDPDGMLVLRDTESKIRNYAFKEVVFIPDRQPING